MPCSNTVSPKLGKDGDFAVRSKNERLGGRNDDIFELVINQYFD
ncbi:hypothetical protein BH23BAC3_BH23BAC3_10030 [soil metagenome]